MKALFKAREISGANVSVVILSQAPWGFKEFERSLPAPIILHLDVYSKEEMQMILRQTSQVQSMPINSQEDFLSCVMGPLLRCTTSVRKLEKSIGYLAHEYWRPVLNGEVSIMILHHLQNWYFNTILVNLQLLMKQKRCNITRCYEEDMSI